MGNFYDAKLIADSINKLREQVEILTTVILLSNEEHKINYIVNHLSAAEVQGTMNKENNND